jgi:leucyl/phenylalanyl-tRNA--protein transferase
MNPETLVIKRKMIIDCQVHTPHLISLGAEEITRQRFSALLQQYHQRQPAATAWQQ